MKTISRSEIENGIKKVLENKGTYESLFELNPLLYPADISNLTCEDWEYLFTYRPSISDIPAGLVSKFIEAKILRERKADFKYYVDIFSETWFNILKKDPLLFCVAKEYYTGWVAAIAANIANFEDWEGVPRIYNLDEIRIVKEFTRSDWMFILQHRPELFKKYKHQISCVVAGLALNPEYIRSCPIKTLKRFNLKDWVFLFSYQPKFAEKYKIFKHLSDDDWTSLLLDVPSLAKKCKRWPFFKLRHWQTLISNKDLLKRAKHYVNGWAAIVSNKPETISECPVLHKFSVAHWETIYNGTHLPPLEYLSKNCHNIEMISSDTWQNIIEENPQYTEIAKKYENGWVGLLWHNPALYEKEFPYWNNRKKYGNFLCISLKLFHRVKWDEIPLNKWQIICAAYPNETEIIKHCPWDKLVEEDWLIMPKKFADKCKFQTEKID